LRAELAYFCSTTETKLSILVDDLADREGVGEGGVLFLNIIYGGENKRNKAKLTQINQKVTFG
jgi:hypothetical protein